MTKPRVTVVANAVLAVLNKNFIANFPGSQQTALAMAPSLAGEIAVAAITAADNTPPDHPAQRLPTALSSVTWPAPMETVTTPKSTS